MRNIVILMMLSGLSACTVTGNLQGVSEGAPVIFEYEQAAFDNSGQLTVSMPDGELFRGKFIQKNTSTSGDSIGLVEGSNNDIFTLSDSSSVSSDTQAVLIGDRGNTMRCHFQFADADYGIDGGGIGQCETSYDRKIDLSF